MKLPHVLTQVLLMSKPNSDIVNKTEQFVREKLNDEATGHDWWHVDRVRNLALYIAEQEAESNTLVVELEALLHDVADHKFHDGDHEIGPRIAAEHLSDLELDNTTIQHVLDCMRVCSYSRGLEPQTLEAAIVQDADRLDALGAIGIARLFATGPHFKQIIYTPKESKETQKTSVGHFYQKIFNLASQMNTGTGKIIAKEREGYMKKYLDKFYAEWNGTE